MRIGINCLSIVPGQHGGAETYLVQLVQHLLQIDKSNKYYLFLTPGNRKLFESTGSENVKLIDCSISNDSRFTRIGWEQFRLSAIVSKLEIDVFHSPGNTAPITMKSPIVLSIQSLHAFKFPKIFPIHKRYYRQILTRLSVKKAARVIAVSSDTKADIVSLFSIPESAINVIYEGVGPEFQPHSSTSDNQIIANYNITEPFIFCPSSLYPYKNIKRLLQAFSILKQDCNVQETLVVAGIDALGHKAELEQKAKKLHVSDHYNFLGMVPYSEMPSFYRKASLVVYPSLSETFGLPLLESMACGTAVVCSDRTSLPEVGGNAVHYFDPTESISMANAIYSVITNESLREDLVEKGFDRAQRFPWTQTAAETLKAYISAVAG